ncbi:MAG: RlmE family RNA methyltransferase [Proteobacteria bacterium]|nr:RlmE family RNA methyltransferase [Pseudomonadota bacterium]MDA0861530.1 RlmE family RNA methyltransferase [Pseudomonadota bacterium]MDA1031149.1 RlmE family RNA methyltransferase [Pseudomonadota bacterium]
MSKRKKTWMQEHVSDPFVKKANADGWRSRASFKLLELLDKEDLVRPGMVVVDLGAAPGGWSQVVSQRMGGDGLVIAVDLLEMSELPAVKVIRGDFGEQETLDVIESELTNRAVDLVISDMAPNISGVKSLDQARWLNLAELALEFALNYLRRDGCIVIKCFEGEGSQTFFESVKSLFRKAHRRKPQASRDRSREFFIVGLNKID